LLSRIFPSEFFSAHFIPLLSESAVTPAVLPVKGLRSTLREDNSKQKGKQRDYRTQGSAMTCGFWSGCLFVEAVTLTLLRAIFGPRCKSIEERIETFWGWDRIAWMPSRRNINLEEVKASLATSCPKCGHTILFAELRTVGFDQIRCPKCGANSGRAQGREPRQHRDRVEVWLVHQACIRDRISESLRYQSLRHLKNEVLPCALAPDYRRSTSGFPKAQGCSCMLCRPRTTWPRTPCVR
jgi:DNA-directed RNA polymerase subunit RPC12/RpoP